jgi:hypothetical protein
MTKVSIGFVLFAALATAAERPRVFVTESRATQASGEASVGDVKGALALIGGTSPESVEVMKTFAKQCPDVVVTANREKADFLVRLDHEGINPTTPFVHGNKLAVFNKDQDLVLSNSTRLLGNAVKEACAAIVARFQPAK